MKESTKAFDKGTCSLCGEKRGVIGSEKLADGTLLCKNCAKKAKLPIEYWFITQKDFREINFEDYEMRVKAREENRKRLECFEKTKGFFGSVQIDEKHGWILFEEDRLFKKKDKLMAKNPPVIDAEKIVVMIPRYKFRGKEKGIIHKYMTAEITMYVGLDDPWITGFRCLLTVVGDCEIEKGIFTDHLHYNLETQELQDCVMEMKLGNLEEKNDEEFFRAFARLADEELFFTKISDAYKDSFLTYKDIKNILKMYCGKDKEKMKMLKKKYRLH